MTASSEKLWTNLFNPFPKFYKRSKNRCKSFILMNTLHILLKHYSMTQSILRFKGNAEIIRKLKWDLPCTVK